MNLPDRDDARFCWTHAGIVKLPGFAAAALADLVIEFERQVDRAPGRCFVRNALAVSPAFRALTLQPIFTDWLTAVLEVPAQPFAGDATRYVGASYWHRDVSGGMLPLAKLAVYLDPAPPAAAHFRYLPGSHAREFFTAGLDPAAPERWLGTAAGWRDVERVLRFQSGDALLFSPRLLHAVDDTAERRQLAVIFGATPATAADRTEMLQLLHANSAVL